MLVVLRFFLLVVFFCIVMLIGIFVVMVVVVFLFCIPSTTSSVLTRSPKTSRLMTFMFLLAAFFQSIVHSHPTRRPHIDEQVTRRFDDIIRGGLIAVQVNAIIQQHGHFGVIRLVTENFSDPIVFRGKIVVTRNLVSSEAAGSFCTQPAQQTNGHYQRKTGNYSFHG